MSQGTFCTGDILPSDTGFCIFSPKSCETKSGMESPGSKVVIMPTSHECFCCCEVESVVKKKEEDEGFESVCLNVWVLQ